MDVIELLKQVGLSQYEAEAYTSLLREGPVTGYELGKRSKVALPRIYDVLARLQARGLVLVQPGEPPRYLAQDPAIFLRQLRRDMGARLDELEARLQALSPRDGGEEFWVIRGPDQIRDHVAGMVETAQHSVDLRLPAALGLELNRVMPAARARCRVLAIDAGDALAGDEVLVLADDCELLAGTIEDPAQAVVSRNRALVALARARATTYTHAPATSSEEAEIATDWLAWEADKQRRLRLLRGGSDVA